MPTLKWAQVLHNQIRKELLQNDKVEAILILPRNMFYSTDISVTLWILNNNKTAREVKVGDAMRKYRNRKGEVLFMDLRQMGEPFEKKYTQFSAGDIAKISGTYHKWQTQKIKDEKENGKELAKVFKNLGFEL